MMKFTKLSISVGLIIIAGIISLLSNHAQNASARYTAAVGAQSEPQRTGPPWFDADWHYRRPIIINSPASLPWYQVLIELDNENFPSFDLAKIDGSDVRMTLSDGITELYYWIESWNRATERAYVWVRVPAVALGETSIYLYYNNLSASSASDGSSTFNSFDDAWNEFIPTQGEQVEEALKPRNEIFSPFNWTVVEGEPETLPPGDLSLAEGTGIKSVAQYLRLAVGFRAKYGLNGDYQRAGFLDTASGQGTTIGDDCQSLPGDLFLINGTQCIEFLPDANWHNAFHVYEIRWKSTQTYGMIDHGVSTASSNSQVPITSLPVVLHSYPGSGATLVVDWVYVRQYNSTEPTVSVGTEQGLVDLGISLQDSPDPLPKNNELTYQLSVHNDSLIDAIGVIVTDTLPASVQFISSNPTGCSHNANVVVCNLNTVAANATATATIVVKPTTDGVITNNVKVDSLDYELDEDWGDNASQEQTLVDTVPPNVNWEKPVENGEKYTTSGGQVTLVASAADNDQVAWVEFWLWDHVHETKITIEKDYTYPYQAQLDSDDFLMANQVYQLFVQAADRAGNISDYRTPPYPVIYMERILIHYMFLPIAAR